MSDPQDDTTIDDEDEVEEDDAPPATMVGEYANYASVGSTQTEFYLDFYHVVPGTSSGNVEQVLPVRRIMISPMLVRGLVRALEEEISSYETTYHLTLPTVEA